MNSLFSDKQIMENEYKLLDNMKSLNIQVVNLSHHRFNLEIFNLVKKSGFKFNVRAISFKYFIQKYISLNLISN